MAKLRYIHPKEEFVYTAEDVSITNEVTSSHNNVDVCTSAWFAAAFVMRCYGQVLSVSSY